MPELEGCNANPLMRVVKVLENKDSGNFDMGKKLIFTDGNSHQPERLSVQLTEDIGSAD